MNFKKIKLLPFFLIFLMSWILFGWNYWNGDRDAYELFYSKPFLAFSDIEISWIGLNLVFNLFAIEYQTFNIVISFFILILYFHFFYKLGNGYIICTIVYLILFFPVDYVLLRNALAIGIILQGFLILLSEYSHRKKTYTVLVLLATTFHQSSIMYLIFALARTDKLINTINSLLIIAFINLILAAAFAMKVAPEFIYQHLRLYPSNFITGLFLSVVHLSVVIYVNLFIFYLLKERQKLIKDLKVFIFVFNINIISLGFIVFYFESALFVRYLRFFILINLIFLTSIWYKKYNIKNLFFLMLLSMFVFFKFNYPFWELTILPLFANNLLF